MSISLKVLRRVRITDEESLCEHLYEVRIISFCWVHR